VFDFVVHFEIEIGVGVEIVFEVLGIEKEIKFEFVSFFFFEKKVMNYERLSQQIFKEKKNTVGGKGAAFLNVFDFGLSFESVANEGRLLSGPSEECLAELGVEF